jgi:hypothetical protein
MVLCAAGAAHRSFLEQEVVPRVSQHVRSVVLLDAGAGVVGRAPLARGDWHPADQLAPILRAIWGEGCIDEQSLDDAWRGPADDFERHIFAEPEVRASDIARIETHPIRLWEALFWRGHGYRYELIDGEVPLVGELFSPLAANRTLMQLVSDAELLEGARAGEGAGWIRCGRFRLRQLEHRVEVRVRLSPADVRVAFGPQAIVPHDDGLPSVLGALMAGGDNGKTELWNGFTWSTIELADPTRSLQAAKHLAAELEAWTRARVTVATRHAFELPDEPREEWFLLPHEKWLTIYVPFGRQSCLPWEIHEGAFWRDRPDSEME